jgi:hypothetical protein
MKVRGDRGVKEFALLPMLFAFVLGVAAVTPVQAELIANGSFEYPSNEGQPYKTYDSSVIPPIPIWTVVTNSVDIVTSGWSNIPAYGGGQFLDLVGSGHGGAISQTLSTLPGQQYSLSFAYSNNYDSNINASAEVIVAGLGSTTNLLPSGLQSLSHSSTETTFVWTLYYATFTADAAETTLLFRETDGLSWNGGILLDAVSLNAVPLPPSILLLGSGLLSLVGFRRFMKG